MKKLLLVFLLISPLAFSQPYEEARNRLKQLLYLFNGLPLPLGLEKDEYNEFIEPYLQEAENNLLIGRYCRENYESNLCGACVIALINYNIACLHYYANLYTRTAKQRLDLYKLRILRAIEKIKDEMGLTDLDVNEELQKTCDLFYQANVAFYKRLSLATKATLWFLPKKNDPPSISTYRIKDFNIENID